MKHVVCRWWLTPLLLITIAGCSQLSAEKPPMMSAQASQALSVSPKITYLAETAADLHRLTPIEIKNRVAALETVYTQDKSEEHRISLAVWLALAPAPAGDRSRAYNLLNMAPTADHLGRQHPIALVLLPSLQEIIALRDAQTKNQLKLRDEQKRSDGLQEKNAALQKKIDALSNVEKKMMDRTPGKPRK